MVEYLGDNTDDDTILVSVIRFEYKRLVTCTMLFPLLYSHTCFPFFPSAHSNAFLEAIT